MMTMMAEVAVPDDRRWASATSARTRFVSSRMETWSFLRASASPAALS
jgi:hypothetical protein